MYRRRVLLFALAAVLLLIGMATLVLVLVLRPHQASTAITREHAARIQRGMTVAQVEALLDGPARDDTTGPLEHDISFTFGGTPGAFQRDWRSDEVVIAVAFHADRRVIDSCDEAGTTVAARAGVRARRALPLARPVTSNAQLLSYNLKPQTHSLAVKRIWAGRVAACLKRLQNRGVSMTAEVLLGKAANVNAADQRGKHTPLHFAAWFGNTELVTLLLAHNADRHAKDDQNRTPLDLANENKHQAVVKLLTK